MPDKHQCRFVAYPDLLISFINFKEKILSLYGSRNRWQWKIIKTPFELDTTHISFFADNKIYSTINSEDKSKFDL